MASTLEAQRMITWIIRYHIDPTKKEQFEQYARKAGCGPPPERAWDFAIILPMSGYRN